MYNYKNKILKIVFLVLNISSSINYGDNIIYINGVHVDRGYFDKIQNKMESCFNHVEKKYDIIKKNISFYNKILFFGLIYFIIESYCDRIAKKIIDSNFFFIFTEVKSDELPKLLTKISDMADFDFIVKMKKIKKEIDFLFMYRYLIYFFIAFPFVHNNIKKIMLNIVNINDGMTLLNNLIIKNDKVLL
jgi:hypothetical protein